MGGSVRVSTGRTPITWVHRRQAQRFSMTHQYIYPRAALCHRYLQFSSLSLKNGLGLWRYVKKLPHLFDFGLLATNNFLTQLLDFRPFYWRLLAHQNSPCVVRDHRA